MLIDILKGLCMGVLFTGPGLPVDCADCLWTVCCCSSHSILAQALRPEQGPFVSKVVVDWSANESIRK